MKRNFGLLVITVSFFAACVSTTNKKESVNALMPKQQVLSYFTGVPNDRYLHDTSLFAFDKPELNIVDYVFDKVLQGNLPVYSGLSDNYVIDTTSEPVSIEDIKTKLNIGFETISYTDENGNVVTQKIRYDFKPEEIKEIGFAEEWKLTDSSFILEKNILEYCFVREYKTENNQLRKLITFSIRPQLDTIINQQWELLGSKISEIFIEALAFSEAMEVYEVSKENWEAGNALFNDRNPFWNFYTYKKLVNGLVENVKSGKVAAVDLKTKKILSFSDIEERMGIVDMMISYTDENGEMITQNFKPELNTSDIKSLIFVEEWYIEKNSLALKKKIKGIAPVHYLSNLENGEIIKSVPCMVVY